MKKLLALLLALVLVLAFAGCNKGGNASPGNAATPTPAPTQAPAPTATPAPTEAPAAVMSHAEYIAAALDSPVTVETYVQDKQSWWDDKANLYCQSEDGAYFIYETYCTEADFAKLLPGTKIRVSGFKSEWSGEVEIIDGSFEIIDGSYVAQPFDATALLGSDALADHMNELASFTGLTVEPSTDADGNVKPWLYKWNGSGQDGDDLYINVSVGGATYSFTVESYLRGAGSEVYEAVKQLEIGDTIDLTAFLYWYEGPNPHIVGIAKQAGGMSHADYIAAELDTPVTVETYVQDKQSWWDDKANLYCQGPDGAYFIYETFCTEEDFAKLVPGTKIRVSGYKSEWSGEVEIIDGSFEILGGPTWVAQPFDATALLGSDALADHMNEYAYFQGLTVAPSTDADGNEVPWLYKWNGSGQDGDDLYFNVSVNGATYSFAVESYLRGAGTEVYEAVKQLQIGDQIDIYAFLYWYEGPNPHVIGVTPALPEGVMSHADYIAAELDTPVTVVTYVQDKQSWWDDKANLYCQSPDGAYFIYETYCTEEDFNKLLPGTKIKVSGYKSEWSGQVEIIDGTFEILEGSYVAPAFDATALLGTDALIDHMNEFVIFTGMTVEPSIDADGNEAAFLYKWNGSGQDGDDLYFNVSVNGNTYSFTVESYLRGAGTEVYEAVKQLQVGDVIDVVGFLYWYEGPNPHVIGFSRAGDLTVDYGSSQLYSQAELDEAIALIRSQFACFGGCKLNSLTYAGDEANNEENLSWLNEMSKGSGNYTQVCEFLSSFHSPADHIVLNPDSEYTGYQWWLARTGNGNWQLLTWGY